MTLPFWTCTVHSMRYRFLPRLRPHSHEVPRMPKNNCVIKCKASRERMRATWMKTTYMHAPVTATTLSWRLMNAIRISMYALCSSVILLILTRRTFQRAIFVSSHIFLHSLACHGAHQRGRQIDTVSYAKKYAEPQGGISAYTWKACDRIGTAQCTGHHGMSCVHVSSVSSGRPNTPAFLLKVKWSTKIVPYEEVRG